MTTASKIVCEITEAGLTSISCALPDPRLIDTLGGLGAGLGTLVAALAAVFGVYEAFKQRSRADKIERKNLLKSVGDLAVDSLESFAEIQGRETYEEAQKVSRAIYDFCNLLSDGDKIEKRYADALTSVANALVEFSLHQPRKDEYTGLAKDIFARLDYLRVRSLVQSGARQARSAMNVILHVSDVQKREDAMEFFEKRAQSIVSMVEEELAKTKSTDNAKGG